uniref:Uncharacterized protein n=1 Tax=Anguilla anguilla TaxID=7936 RepID=A0A0E9TVY4_ANGAN
MVQYIAGQDYAAHVIHSASCGQIDRLWQQRQVHVADANVKLEGNRRGYLQYGDSCSRNGVLGYRLLCFPLAVSAGSRAEET